jgi:protein SCO1/2
MVLSGVVRGTRSLALTAGRDFEVVAISFDPRDTPEIARAKRDTYLKEYKHPGAEAGWHFLTASESAARAVADSVGFHYAWDPASNQFVHPSAIMILTPEGRVSRYLYGIDYPSRDMKLSLIEASGGTIGAPTDRILLFCFHYDPANGRYSLMIINILRAMCIALLAALAAFMIVMFRRDAHAATGLREHHP